uniref:DUF3475 domain-containing protein n=1 Tax=Steinernema glaseri TaxID=37863 RepID=A0A1I8A7I4_9BILA
MDDLRFSPGSTDRQIRRFYIAVHVANFVELLQSEQDVDTDADLRGHGDLLMAGAEKLLHRISQQFDHLKITWNVRKEDHVAVSLLVSSVDELCDILPTLYSPKDLRFQLQNTQKRGGDRRTTPHPPW